MTPFEVIFVLIVAVVLTICLCKFAYNVYAHRLRKYFGGPKDITSLVDASRWAVVTGGTEGIGLAFAKALAKMNFNVAITCFSSEKLEEARRAIMNEKPGAIVKTITCDFSDDSYSVRKIIQNGLSGMDVAVLINNAGVCYPRLLDFEDVSAELITRIIAINCMALTHMCHILMPRMAKSPNRSVVINMSSYSATTAVPFMSVYAATKSYIRGLTRSLASEYQDSNITIQCLVPMLVATKLSGIHKASFFVPDPDTFVSDALLTVGCLRESPGCLAHYIQKSIFSLMPARMYKRRAQRKKEMFAKMHAAESTVDRGGRTYNDL